MGLIFYPHKITLPPDHFLHRKVAQIPDRAAKQKFIKDWVIRGPYIDSDTKDYYFRLQAPKLKLSHMVTIPEADALFDESAVEKAISRLIAKAMEIELSYGFAQRLHGESKEKVLEPGNDEIIIVENGSRDTGDVRRQRLSRDREGDVPGNPGGLIIPA
jgi:hypothetical protein